MLQKAAATESQLRDKVRVRDLLIPGTNQGKWDLAATKLLLAALFVKFQGIW